MVKKPEHLLFYDGSSMTVVVCILRALFGVFEAVSSIAWAGLELSAELTPPPPTLSLTPVFLVCFSALA